MSRDAKIAPYPMPVELSTVDESRDHLQSIHGISGNGSEFQMPK
jgi:hypothetical protein